MGDLKIGEPGRTLAPAICKGSADLRRRPARYTVRRAAVVVLAIAAFATGIAATAAVLKGRADPGVEGAVIGEPLVSVSPFGYAWRNGVRPGQFVLELGASDDPDGWRIKTRDPGGTLYSVNGSDIEAALRQSLPIAAIAFLAAAVAVFATRTNRALVGPCAWIAFSASATPLVSEGSPFFSTFALAASAALPAAWILSRIGGPTLRVGLGLAIAGALGLWGAARFGGLPMYDTLDSYRSSFALVGGAGFIAERILTRRARGAQIHVTRPDVAEVLSVAVLAAAAVALVTLLQAPPLVVVALVVVGAIALPAIRRRVRPVEDALLADIRAQAAADGAEAERARLARELHDVPLQELIATIRILDTVPGAEIVRDNLRAVTGHLRDVAIDLRPPVLDDLGLPAALQELAEESSRGGPNVETALDAEPSFDPHDRPPPEVELAMFRIASEAVSNSLRHASASSIAISGTIRKDRVAIVVSDDGQGSPELADRRGGRHIGLSAMRRRAQAVDADLSIESSNAGTAVRAEWHG